MREILNLTPSATGKEDLVDPIYIPVEAARELIEAGNYEELAKAISCEADFYDSEFDMVISHVLVEVWNPELAEALEAYDIKLIVSEGD